MFQKFVHAAQRHAMCRRRHGCTCLPVFFLFIYVFIKATTTGNKHIGSVVIGNTT